MIAYTYDGLQRLTGAVESPGSSFTYSYDLAGNRTGVTVDGTAVLTDTYDAADQVVGWTYDAAGNLTNDGTTSYSYDATNDLTQTTTGAQTNAYVYNGDGTLVGQTANGTTTNYTQDLAADQSQILASTVGMTTTDYLYGQDTAPLVALTGGTRTWYGVDGQGSVRQSLDDSGTILGAANYDPFGQIEAGSSLIGPFGYTGELQDPTTGQEYLRARWYQPGTGQLLGVDPLLDVTGQPYSYAGNDPINGSDPSGQCDVYVSPIPFGLPGSGDVGFRQHVLGTSDNHILCTDILKNDVGAAAASATQWTTDELGATGWGRNVLTTISQFNNSDLSGAVNGDVAALRNGAEAYYNTVQLCKNDPGTCATAAEVLGSYIQSHPTAVLNSLRQAAVGQLQTYGCEIDQHQYGALAGHLLVLFVATKGTAALGNILDEAAAVDAPLIATSWQQQEDFVYQTLQRQYPGSAIGQQVTLDVTGPSGQTVRIRADDLVALGNGAYKVVDAKFSAVKDLSDPNLNLTATLTRNQRTAYAWIDNGSATRIVPVGANAETVQLRLAGKSISVSGPVDLYVNSPRGIVIRHL